MADVTDQLCANRFYLFLNEMECDLLHCNLNLFSHLCLPVAQRVNVSLKAMIANRQLPWETDSCILEFLMITRLIHEFLSINSVLVLNSGHNLFSIMSAGGQT